MSLHKSRYTLQILILFVSFLSSQNAAAHGGVAFEDDLCVINIDFLQAHFTVFQPETRESDEFCEDIPDVARSVFVMEYLHSLLPEMAIDFRIVRDINEVGRYATLDDVLAIDDLEAATVYYEPPRIEPGGFYTASYEFDAEGTYIGVVTADHPTEDRYYTAVFYFQVGGPDYGTLPLFLALLLVLQTGYWLSNGGWERRKQRLAAKNQASQ
ncbi:MAG: hypothetical protein P8N94_07875 [Gammaproteobacteria bacterium]|jgi:hypothetical protein|nr:hypothetical protein [Gammaproteobacteria bacterium]MDG2337894.1 hypothetical protein [Gammaproteobacteria bacterium]